MEEQVKSSSRSGMQFGGKVALVTGAAQGLGKSFAAALLQRGSRVCLADINATRLEVTCNEFRTQYGKDNVTFAECDVSSEPQLKDVFKKVKDDFSKLDIVVNNAGIVDEKNWTKCIDINLNGVIRGTLLGLEHLRKDKGGDGGTIVNISSLAGVFPVNYTPAYSASKHAVIGYTRSWAEHPDATKNNVRLVCLCPAFADTEILSFEEEKTCGAEMAREMIQKSGVMSINEVTDAFVKILQDTDNNGEVLVVTKRGMKYTTFHTIQTL